MVFLFLLVLLYTLVVSGFIGIFYDLLKIPIPIIYLSLLISLAGGGLGISFFIISALKKNIKNYIITTIIILIIIVFALPYLQLRLDALEESVMLLLGIGIFFGLCSLPATIVYAHLKNKKDILIISSILIMFFFFYIRFLKGDFSYLTNEIPILILFFLTFLCYIELGNKSFYYKSLIKRIKPQNEDNDIALINLNKVMNKYFIYLFVFF